MFNAEKVVLFIYHGYFLPFQRQWRLAGLVFLNLWAGLHLNIYFSFCDRNTRSWDKKSLLFFLREISIIAMSEDGDFTKTVK